ncbi:MAG: small basic protein [Candidatus Omnitrophica bacterium]|nr:small basic protein [Candidatus Omnitrophota bacterium]MDD5610381.1 small basic protein [Candidatus Omnitrophota bacterium]
MSIHPSLGSSEKGKKHRTVLGRGERLKMMLDKGQWKEGDKVFGLPKVKIVRMKIKKEKAEKVAAEGTVGAAPAAAAAPAAKPGAAKPGAEAKTGKK